MKVRISPTAPTITPATAPNHNQAAALPAGARRPYPRGRGRSRSPRAASMRKYQAAATAYAATTSEGRCQPSTKVPAPEIGRASCRERGEDGGVAGALET